MTIEFTRGSEWRKWDLHVHTPCSIVQGYGGDTSANWEKFITELEQLPAEFKALGINDYIFLDGYIKVLEFKSQNRLQNIEIIFPVIELRLDQFASLGDGAWKKVNFHIIFSDKLTAREIQDQFISAIHHKIKLSPDIDEFDFVAVATKDSLVDLGKKIKEKVPSLSNETDLHVGFSNITFNYEIILERLKGYFLGKCLTAVGKSEWDTMRWTGSHAIKKTIINNANFSFTALEKWEDHKKHKDVLEKEEVKSFLLDCSDSHFFADSDQKDKIGHCFTWLKADLTFEGLKQIANDSERIFVGVKPSSLIRAENNKTKIIREIRITKIENSSCQEKWFQDFKLPLNSLLTAIIGNKGGGKSAIADAIGLAGKTKNFEYFSFLTSAKFRNKKPYNLSEQFEVNIEWSDGKIDKALLSQNPDSGDVEKVKYLPQGFLERLCNRKMDEPDIFEPELRNVIYSHIPKTERFGKNNLNELIEYKTEIINKVLENIKIDIILLNAKIVELEKKESSDYKITILQQIQLRKDELEALETIKPIPIVAPDDASTEERNLSIKSQINERRLRITAIEQEMNLKISRINQINIALDDFDKIIQTLSGLEEQLTQVSTIVNPLLAKHNFPQTDIIEFKVDTEPILLNKSSLVNEKIRIQEEIGKLHDSGIMTEVINLKKEIEELLDSLDSPYKIYETYLSELGNWEVKRTVIIGSSEVSGSLKQLEDELDYINNRLSIEINEKLDSRKDAVLRLFRKKEESLQLYKSLFAPVSDFISKYGQELGDYAINLDVDYKISGLSSKFFDHVSLGSKGSFIGHPEGIEKLNGIIEKHNLKTENGIISFLDEVLYNLKNDTRLGNEDEKREIVKQLKKGYSPIDLYTFLFELEYLEPEFKLKLGDKSVSELSPGERGALLLIFYLSLDQDDIPLIIDQPEENLDNQSIFKILVQFIKRSKEKRQIIIVTHNPNLAVACQAEQIVYVNIDKTDANYLGFISGSLENEEMNNATINILEGTFPALHFRNSTYNIFKRG